MRRLAERRPEGPDEVRLGGERDGGEGRDVERLRVGAVHRVTRAEQPAVGFFDGEAHRPNDSTSAHVAWDNE